MDYDDVLVADYFDIDSGYLAQILFENREHFGSTDWDIYIYEDGTLDCRHITHSTSGWTELIDLYSWQYDEETFDLPLNEIASWLQEDIIPAIEIDSDSLSLEMKTAKIVSDIEQYLEYAIYQLKESDLIEVSDVLKAAQKRLRHLE